MCWRWTRCGAYIQLEDRQVGVRAEAQEVEKPHPLLRLQPQLKVPPPDSLATSPTSPTSPKYPTDSDPLSFFFSNQKSDVRRKGNLGVEVRLCRRGDFGGMGQDHAARRRLTIAATATSSTTTRCRGEARRRINHLSFMFTLTHCWR